MGHVKPITQTHNTNTRPESSSHCPRIRLEEVSSRDVECYVPLEKGAGVAAFCVESGLVGMYLPSVLG